MSPHSRNKHLKFTMSLLLIFVLWVLLSFIFPFYWKVSRLKPILWLLYWVPFDCVLFLPDIPSLSLKVTRLFTRYSKNLLSLSLCTADIKYRTVPKLLWVLEMLLSNEEKNKMYRLIEQQLQPLLVTEPSDFEVAKKLKSTFGVQCTCLSVCSFVLSFFFLSFYGYFTN